MFVCERELTCCVIRTLIRLFLDFTNLYSFPVKEVFVVSSRVYKSKENVFNLVKKWGEIIKHKGGNNQLVNERKSKCIKKQEIFYSKKELNK